MYIFFCVGLQIADPQLHKLCLIEIEILLVSNGRSLKEFVSLPQPAMSNTSFFQNTFIVDELNYDKEDMGRQYASMLESLNTEQVKVYRDHVSSNFRRRNVLFFLYGYSDTGKTFIWRTLSCALRSKGVNTRFCSGNLLN